MSIKNAAIKIDLEAGQKELLSYKVGDRVDALLNIDDIYSNPRSISVVTDCDQYRVIIQRIDGSSDALYWIDMERICLVSRKQVRNHG